MSRFEFKEYRKMCRDAAPTKHSVPSFSQTVLEQTQPYICTFHQLANTCIWTRKVNIKLSHIKPHDLAWYNFTSFCSTFSEAISPVNIPIICAFMIQGLLAGMQFHLRCADPSVNSLLGNSLVKLMLQGFKRSRPQSRDICLPFTIPLMHKLLSYLREGCFDLTFLLYNKNC